MKPANPPAKAASRGKIFPWETVLSRLAHHYEVGNWRVPFLNSSSHDPWHILVSTILSQRTRDEVTYPVADELYRHYSTVKDFAEAPLPDLERLIRRVGFHQAKAQAIKEGARQLQQVYGGRVPKEMDLLLELPMVGRKTAGCVLVYGYDVPAIPVDTHVHRICHLFGVTNTKTPDETEEALRNVVPRSLWKAVNPLLVQHGQNICRPIGPKCGECPVQRYCAAGRQWKQRLGRR